MAIAAMTIAPGVTCLPLICEWSDSRVIEPFFSSRIQVLNRALVGPQPCGRRGVPDRCQCWINSKRTHTGAIASCRGGRQGSLDVGVDRLNRRHGDQVSGAVRKVRVTRDGEWRGLARGDGGKVGARGEHFGRIPGTPQWGTRGLIKGQAPSDGAYWDLSRTKQIAPLRWSRAAGSALYHTDVALWWRSSPFRRAIALSMVDLVGSLEPGWMWSRGYAGLPELQVLGGGVHARSALLELPAGADVAVNLCHAGSIRLWNSPRKGKVFLK